MYKVYKGDSIDPQAALDFCASLGFEQEFREMMVLDSVILNPDRHTGNFGFLIDNTTFEIIGFAPMFDHNFSLLCRAMRSDLCSESALLDYMSMLGHKIGDRYIPAAKALLNDTIRERLLSIKDMDIKEHSLYNLPKERLCTLNSIIHNYIDQILEISPARAFVPVS